MQDSTEFVLLMPPYMAAAPLAVDRAKQDFREKAALLLSLSSAHGEEISETVRKSGPDFDYSPFLEKANVGAIDRLGKTVDFGPRARALGLSGFQAAFGDILRDLVMNRPWEEIEVNNTAVCEAAQAKAREILHPDAPLPLFRFESLPPMAFRATLSFTGTLPELQIPEIVPVEEVADIPSVP